MKLSGEVGRASGAVSEEDNEGEFTLVTTKRRGAATRHERRSASGAILIGGSNVRRISSAARNEFDIDRQMFRSVPGIVTEDVPSYMSNAVRKTGGKEMDVVLHVGGDDLAAERSVDYVLEGLANAIESSRKLMHVREVFVCSIEERQDLAGSFTKRRAA